MVGDLVFYRLVKELLFLTYRHLVFSGKILMILKLLTHSLIV